MMRLWKYRAFIATALFVLVSTALKKSIVSIVKTRIVSIVKTLSQSQNDSFEWKWSYLLVLIND
jgi:type III secretory pathway component EscS